MEDSETDHEDLPEPVDKHHWQALFRGSVLANQLQNLVTFVTIADQKAQVMLFINSLVIPFILPGVDNPQYRYAAIIALGTASLTIFFAVMTVFPRGPARFKKRQYHNLLHFSDIKQFSSLNDYLLKMEPVYNDMGLLGREALKYAYDTSRYILKGKYFWLRLCYGGFLIGNALAIAVFLLSLASYIN